MFSNYIQETTTAQLTQLLNSPEIKDIVKVEIGTEIVKRSKGENLTSKPVTIWTERSMDEWEQITIPFNCAKNIASNYLLECRNCWAIISNLISYIDQQGYCKNCKENKC